ncbi:hypothetical protein INR49_030268 [Caranx melampygus]|nr:hypothetical protein INR49_030268 [Caranx melampygus]
MSFQWKLLILILALYLEGQVHGGKIVGGHEAVPHSRPYMVLLELYNKDAKIQHCGGFLLNEDFVMTAAHCQAESYKVFLGLHNFHKQNDAQILLVEEAFPHKKYNPETFKNDIMLLKLKSKANFTKNVKPIAIADQDNGSLPKSCIVSGWGKSNTDNKYMSAKLMEVSVTLADDRYCVEQEVYCSEGETGPEKLSWMDLTMFGHYRVVMMILALTLGDQVTRGIYGGHEAVPHSRPYMVLVEKHMKNGGTGYCAGFLLNEDFVMTAAVCQADSYIVFLGLHDYHNRSETQVIYVEVAFPHKDYNPETYSNDIMLLKGDAGSPLVCGNGQAYGVVSVKRQKEPVYAGEIYGGHEAVPHSRPYMVLVEADGGKRHCGGFLLNEDFVMTAAHCQAMTYEVFLGLHDVHNRKHAEARIVEAAYPHKNYSRKDIRHDIMLLKLSTKATFSNSVEPIALADNDDGSLPKSCIVSGWGRDNKSSNFASSKLMEANVTLTDDTVCANYKMYCSEGEIGPGGLSWIDLTMFLVMLMLSLALDGQVYAGEIYGGGEAVPHSRPYMVLLEQQKNGATQGHCGGFLLNEDFVVTAAHCQANNYTVLLGLHNIHDNEEIQRVSVKETFPHKGYGANQPRNDIMLLKLSWIDLTMFLVMLMLSLALDGQVYAGEIYGGDEAVPNSRPYMVLLEQHMKNGATKHCGGFLLNEDFVVTAAHCQANNYTVLLGLHNIHDNEEIQRVSVKETFPHKDYDAAELTNDIMLLKLESKAHFNKKVKPIAPADQDNGTLPKSCIVSGWGRSNRDNKLMTPALMEVKVTLIHHEWCVAENLYCSKGESGPAEGDSGGPLVCEGQVYGLVSFSTELDGSQMYCFIKIPVYKTWIDEIIGRHGNNSKMSNHSI